MQVRKFEAKSMKEALDLVKVHMGPEAIILSAKDSHRGFGLMGEKSVEVTAAVSEETLRKKKVAESKLREDLRTRFQQIPATKQREFINRVFEDREERKEEKRELAMAGAARYPIGKESAESRAQASGLRYADIEDEETSSRNASQDRVRRAAERARLASREILQDPAPKRVPQKSAPKGYGNGTGATAANIPRRVETPAAPVAPTGPSAEMLALESQVRELKSLVEKFQHMPQNPMSMHPGAEQGLPFELSPVYQRLTGQGIQVQIVSGMLKKAQKELDFESLKRPAMVEAWIVRQLLNSVEVSKDPFAGRYHVFMGSTGQGKTTSLVKFASELVLKQKKTIAIISLDTIKVGAADQLKIYAQILNVPFAVVRSQEEWRVAEAKLGHLQHILVDCPGLNLRSMEEVDWLKAMLPPPEFNRSIHYVQSVLARDEEAMDLAGRYQMLGFHDVIFTRLDESSRQGLILNFQEHFKKPMHSFGTGSRIPEDYEFATKERVIDFIFKLSKVSRKEESV
ncbi:MAG: flagellar biosynthesis protein FlhF [Bdellovibrionales bacterium]